MLNHLKKLITEFNDCKTDKERFGFIIKHKGIFTLMLDNDQTCPIISDHISHQFSEADIEDLPELNEFFGYLGESSAVIDLLEVIGVKGKPV